MRKLLIFSLLMLFIVAVIPLGGTAFAEREMYELPDDYLAEIAYCYYYLASGEVMAQISVTFDEEFFAQDIDFSQYTLWGLLLVETLQDRGYDAEYLEGGKIQASLNFSSVTDLNISIGVDGYDNSKSNAEADKGLFFIDYTSKSKTVFANIKSDEESLFFYILSVLNAFGIDDERVLLNYSYGTPYKIISSNAEKTAFDSQMRIYVHDFYMDVDDSDRYIEIYQHAPNSVVWYSFALGGAIVLGVLFMLIHVAKRKGR